MVGLLIIALCARGEIVKRVIGVTGGIASGKSNVCNIIEKMGLFVIDCDKISYDLTKKGGPIYKVILEKFGNEYLLDNDEIDRKKLARLIFNNLEAKNLLNSITHPIIIDDLNKKIEESDEKIIFLEAPLLYETHLDNICDKIICVYLDEKLQLDRLMMREGIDEQYALAKIHSQMDLNIKKSLADYVIDTKGTFEETRMQVDKVINDILKECN